MTIIFIKNTLMEVPKQIELYTYGLAPILVVLFLDVLISYDLKNMFLF